MSNFRIWNCENELMVEVFDESNLVTVQKEILDKGYFIIEICRGVFNSSTFIRISELHN